MDSLKLVLTSAPALVAIHFSQYPFPTAFDSSVESIPTFSACDPATFHRFSEQPTEIWHFTLHLPVLSPQKFTVEPMFLHSPAQIPALMHVNHEARSELLSTYQLLRFSTRIIMPGL
jgi:hypothetical protein